MSHIRILRLSRRMADFVCVLPHGIKNMSGIKNMKKKLRSQRINYYNRC